MNRRQPHSMFDLDREDDERDAQLIRDSVGKALAEALKDIQVPNGGVVIIQNLTVNVGSINSARGGGASVTVNQIQVDRPEAMAANSDVYPIVPQSLPRR